MKEGKEETEVIEIEGIGVIEEIEVREDKIEEKVIEEKIEEEMKEEERELEAEKIDYSWAIYQNTF